MQTSKDSTSSTVADNMHARQGCPGDDRSLSPPVVHLRVPDAWSTCAGVCKVETQASDREEPPGVPADVIPEAQGECGTALPQCSVPQ